MGRYILVLVFAVTIHIGFFTPTPLDELTVNLNLNENIEEIYGEEEEEELFEKSSKIFPNSGATLPKSSDLSSDTECGRENVDKAGSDYISGGEKTLPHQYPWMVQIVGVKKNRKRYNCGGSLISDRVVLTAYHCIRDRVSYDGVRVGANNVRAKDHQLVKVKMALWPKVHWRLNRYFDFGILILEQPVDLSDGNIGTICLPAKGMENKLIGKTARALGWGRQYGNKASAYLKQVDLKITHLRGLNAEQQKLLMFTEIKYKDSIPQDPCAGDSGGPLQYQNKQNGRWTILGTLWGFGYSCIHNKFITDYNGKGVWSRITPHLEWIHCVVRDESDNCFEYDFRYTGEPLNKPGSDNNYGSTGSATSCQRLCQNTPGCAWFNWAGSYDGCWLKKGKGNKSEYRLGVVTGPRSCEPEKRCKNTRRKYF